MKRIILFSVAIVALIVTGCQNESMLEPASHDQLVQTPGRAVELSHEKSGQLPMYGILYFPSGGGPYADERIIVKGGADYRVVKIGTSRIRYTLNVKAKLFPKGETPAWKISGDHSGEAVISDDGTAVVVCEYPVFGWRDVVLRAKFLVNQDEVKLTSMQLQRRIDW